jgi:MFS transporter, FSR family, fosmidomycin resistance protein
LVLAGGVALVVELGFFAAASSFEMLLVVFMLMYPASGAFVSLAQATLMDLEPNHRESNMARWTLAGSVGVVLGPLVLALASAAGLGWRGLMLVFAVCTVPVVAAVRRLPFPKAEDHATFKASLRAARGAVRNRRVIRWLVLLQFGDLILDGFFAYLALYLVDVVGLSAVSAGIGVAVWTGAGLLGDALLLVILRRMPGILYLRISAALVLLVFPAFLLVPWFAVKLVLLALLGILNAGWYAIPQAGLYAAVPENSGALMAVSSATDLVGLVIPLSVGLLANAAGLGTALWLCLAAPVAFLALLPRAGEPEPKPE